MENVVDVRNVSKEFKVLKKNLGLKGRFTNFFSRDYKIIKALDKINLTIKKGEFVGIIGPNGAGKSTLIKILTGILTPEIGTAKVFNYIPYKQRREYTKDIGVVFGQRTQLWWDLPVRDTYDLLSCIYKIPKEKFKENLNRFVSVLDIDKYLDTPVRKLSLGERMRCDLAASLLHEPKIVFLDEPTIGLDVEAKFRIREFLKDINSNGTTVILTTHDMGDIEELCPRLIIIDKGKKIYDGSLEKVKEKFSKERILTIDFFEEIDERKIGWKGIKSVKKSGERIILTIETEKITTSTLIKKILARWPIYDITIEEPQIEEVIRKIYRKGF